MSRIKMKQDAIEVHSIQSAFDLYLKECKVKGYADATIKYYKNTLQMFSNFYDLQKNVTELTKEVMEDYYLYLRDKNLAENTIKTYIVGLKTILKYFMGQGWIKSFEIQTPKAEKTFKEIYTEEELKKLLKKPDINKCSFAEYRNWVMVAYFCGTGQRLLSVINIKNKHIDLKNETVTLTKTKGKRYTILPLPPSLVDILGQYMNIRKGTEEDYLFCNQDGSQLTRGGVTAAIQKYNQKRGVRKTSIHLFRHSFATYYLQNGGNLFYLQKLLGHADITSTQRYLNTTIGDLKANMSTLNPLERTIKSKITMGKRRA